MIRTNNQAENKPDIMLRQFSFFPTILFLSVVFFIISLILPITPIHATVLQVPGDYGSITAAVASASTGDRIEVGPGTYYESFASNLTGIEIVGNGAIIDLQGNKWSIGSNSKIEGFKFVNGVWQALFLDGTNITIQNCIINAAVRNIDASRSSGEITILNNLVVGTDRLLLLFGNETEAEKIIVSNNTFISFFK